MAIEKKFNMFSTREWIQYLQHKISSEREKELEDQATRDPFLKEAIDVIGTQENRPVAFQSISYLISVIEENTGISESKITRVQTARSSSEPSFNPKLIMIILGGLVLALLIGFGIYYVINTPSNSVEEVSASIADSASVSASYADSSSRPFDVIPGTSAPTMDTTPKTVTAPTSSASKPIKTNSGNTASNSTSSQGESSSKPTSSVSNTPSAPTSSKERELFSQAQDLFKQGNREEAKKILNELKSYDNPMKTQSENILKNMGN